MATSDELEIDVVYEDDEDTAVMPLGAIRELLQQERREAQAFAARAKRKSEPALKAPHRATPQQATT